MSHGAQKKESELDEVAMHCSLTQTETSSVAV